MTKPVITTRATKGSALTWTEGDTNLENLRDATITVKADTGGTDVVSDLNGTLTLVAGTNVTITGDNTAKTVTINSTASGATTLDGLSDVVITAAATNDILRFDGTNWVDTALSGVTVGTASVGSTVTLTADNTTNATEYPLFSSSATGNVSPRTDTGFTYNPSTGTLTATTFSGAATTVTLTADNTTNATNYPLFSSSATGSVSPRTDTGFTYNPSTGALTAASFSGSGSGLTSIPNSALTNSSITINGSAISLGGTVSTGTVTSVAALTLGTTGTDVSSTVATGTTTPVITLNIPTASATNRGALSSTDWSTFNGKQAALVSGTNIKTINSTSLLGSGDITVSASAAGSNQQIQFNNSGVFGSSSSLIYDGTSLKCSSGNVESLYSNGDEGGEFRLAKPQTNTTLAGDVTIDIYQNKLRIFENGGSSRGAYIDLTAASGSVGSNLLGGGGIASVSADTAPTLGGNLSTGGYSILGNTNIVTVGESNTNVSISTNGTADLILNTNGGTNSGAITIFDGANQPILLEPNGTGDVYLRSDRVYVGDTNANCTVTTDGTGDLILNTNGGTNSGAITIFDAANGDITITPNGTGKTKINAINYNEGALYDLGTTGGTIAPDVANGNVQKITLNSALTINAFTSPVAGQSLTLIIYGGTAYTSITSTMKFAGGVKTLTGTAGCIDILSVYYDGTNYFASLGKGFA